MIVWGGLNYPSYLNTGGRYNPSTDSWTATSTTNAPSARYRQPAVWSGSEMIVWGGRNRSGYLNTGGRYNGSEERRTDKSSNNTPNGRGDDAAGESGNIM